MPKLIAAFILLVLTCVPVLAGDYVVVLHGLGRTENSMLKLALALGDAGYQVLNLDYDSRHKTIADLADTLLNDAVIKYCVEPEARIHFVTHSLGGIVVRYYLQQHPQSRIGRVVMMAPPNRGSALAAFWGRVWPVNRWLGPNLTSLGTDSSSFVNQLGPVTYETGVIAGNRSYNPLFSFLIDGIDDGKVAVEQTRVTGMRDFMVLRASHSFLMNSDEAIALTLKFLARGTFQ